jgi:ABC-type branched-subunit amino acid transport system substrate-binding protein
MRKVLLVLSFIFSAAFAVAQQPPAAYLKAKSDLEAKAYGIAKDGFVPFLDEATYGVLSYYAVFHSAEAALQLGQAPQAIEFLSSLKGKAWSKSEEQTYLLALAYFQNKQLVQGLQTLKGITREPFLSKGYRASFENLKTASSNFLITNLAEFKENQGFTAALAYVLQQKSIMSADERGTLNQLIQSGSQAALKDKVLDVVVILPFTSNSTQAISTLESTNFLLELYQGIALEVASLKSQGVAIQLHTFDSKRDLNYLNALVKDPTVLAADVIVGPIYPEESELVSAFAEAQKIPFIHPLSNLGNRFEESQFSYLFRPSLNSLANGVVDALKSQAWGKTVAIGYSGSSRDEQLGLLLQSQLQKEGFTIAKVQKVDSKSASTFLQGLGVRRGNRPAVDQVILLSDDPALAQPVFSLMESISTKVPLLVMDSWLGFNFSNYEMLEFANFYFISNNTPKYQSEEMDTFRDLFYEKHLQFPSTNALLGAELVHWIHSNAEFANDFDLRPSLDRNGYQSGRLSWGFNFQKVNNNSYSPVFKLESGELIPLH